MGTAPLIIVPGEQPSTLGKGEEKKMNYAGGKMTASIT
jgi:hypothetical protein